MDTAMALVAAVDAAEAELSGIVNTITALKIEMRDLGKAEEIYSAESAKSAEIDERVRDIGVVEVAVRTRPGAPLVERLRGEAEHPTAQIHRHAIGCEVLHQREHHFGS